MYYQEFYRWCWDAVRKIKFPPDRNKVYVELYDHMLDRYQSMLDRGVSAEDAEKRTLEAMGNADELAIQLAAIHRPFWGYALRFARLIAVAALVLTLVFGVRYAYQEISALDWDTAEWGRGMDRELYTLVADVKDSSDGYTFQVTDVALWRKELTEPIHGKYYYDHLFLRLEVTKPVFWAFPQQATDAMWAVDSAGVYYDTVMRETTQPDGIQYMGLVHRRGDKIYDLYFSSVSEDLEWIELHYDRDGRDIVLHVDLTGGGDG